MPHHDLLQGTLLWHLEHLFPPLSFPVCLQGCVLHFFCPLLVCLTPCYATFPVHSQTPFPESPGLGLGAQLCPGVDPLELLHSALGSPSIFSGAALENPCQEQLDRDLLH